MSETASPAPTLYLPKTNPASLLPGSAAATDTAYRLSPRHPASHRPTSGKPHRPDFREPPRREVPRMHLPRRSVNRQREGLLLMPEQSEGGAPGLRLRIGA